MRAEETVASVQPTADHPAVERGDALLDVGNLVVSAGGADASRTILSSVDLFVRRGETVGLVGESGSGKSMLAKAVVGLLPAGVEQTAGRITFDGTELNALAPRARAAYRGDRMTLLFQDPFTSLNPLLRCGKHIVEGLRLQSGGHISRAAGRAAAITRLAEVGIDDPSVVDRYPFQLSGGMRQRVALAAALARDPQLLLADEPSTALDVTTQAEILDLLRRTQVARGMSMIFITHDLRVAFSVCDRVYVLYAGSVLEAGDGRDIQRAPTHPYTLGLLLSEPTARQRQAELQSIEGTVPRPDDVAGQCPFAPRCQWAQDICRSSRPALATLSSSRQSRCVRIADIEQDMARARQGAVVGEVTVSPARIEVVEQPIATVDDVHKTFRVSKGGTVAALRGVSLAVGRGEAVGLVGESGSGKTTLGRCVAGLEQVTSGTINLQDRNGGAVGPRDPRARRIVQVVFQDPFSSLDPRQRIGHALAEPLRNVGMSRHDAQRRAGELLDLVGLPASYERRRPDALSGGERQRVAIARGIVGRSAAARLRRAGVGPRRVGAGADPEAVPVAAPRSRPEPALHHPRPGGRAPGGRHRAHHAPRPHRRVRVGRRRDGPPAGRVHPPPHRLDPRRGT